MSTAIRDRFEYSFGYALGAYQLLWELRSETPLLRWLKTGFGLTVHVVVPHLIAGRPHA